MERGGRVVFCCCFCRATAVSTKKAVEGQDFVVGPHNPKEDKQILSVKALAAVARTSNGGRSGKAADAYHCSAGCFLTGQRL